MINNNFLDEMKQIMNIESGNNEELDGILTGKDNQEVKQCYDIIRLLDYFTNENYCNNTKESIVRKYMDDCLENGELIMSKYICKILFNEIFSVLHYVDQMLIQKIILKNTQALIIILVLL